MSSNEMKQLRANFNHIKDLPFVKKLSKKVATLNDENKILRRVILQLGRSLDIPEPVHKYVHIKTEPGIADINVSQDVIELDSSDGEHIHYKIEEDESDSIDGCADSFECDDCNANGHNCFENLGLSQNEAGVYMDLGQPDRCEDCFQKWTNSDDASEYLKQVNNDKEQKDESGEEEEEVEESAEEEEEEVEESGEEEEEEEEVEESGEEEEEEEEEVEESGEEEEEEVEESGEEEEEVEESGEEEEEEESGEEEEEEVEESGEEEEEEESGEEEEEEEEVCCEECLVEFRAEAKAIAEMAKKEEEEEEESGEEDEEIEVEEEEEVYEITIKGTKYFTTNEKNGDIYSIDSDGDPCDVVGKFVNGRQQFN
jgi:hypothetical protein